MLLNLQIDFYHSLQVSSGINQTPWPKKPQRDILRQGKEERGEKKLIWLFGTSSANHVTEASSD